MSDRHERERARERDAMDRTGETIDAIVRDMTAVDERRARASEARVLARVRESLGVRADERAGVSWRPALAWTIALVCVAAIGAMWYATHRPSAAPSPSTPIASVAAPRIVVPSIATPPSGDALEPVADAPARLRPRSPRLRRSVHDVPPFQPDEPIAVTSIDVPPLASPAPLATTPVSKEEIVISAIQIGPFDAEPSGSSQP